MYFSNIGNEEVENFHKSRSANFTMSLSEILNSDLFVHEGFVNNSIFKLYPLFYCNEISTNNEDNIVVNENCLIVQDMGEHETYISFKDGKNSKNITLTESDLELKSVGDNLTHSEFNKLVYLYRRENLIKGSINFEEENRIEGVYGEYVLNNVVGQLRNDRGFIINDKIKNNSITIKLLNPFFLSANYVLTCTVRSITGANVCEGHEENYKLVDRFNVTLVNGSEVELNVSDYTNDSVLDFNFELQIDFNKAEIVNRMNLFSLTSDTDVVVYGDDFNLIATLSGEDNVQGYVVNFYESGTLIGYATTDENGVAVLNYTPSAIGNYNYSATSLGLTSQLNVRVGKYNTEISLESDKNLVYVPSTFTLSGTLENEAGPLPNTSFKLMKNNVFYKTLTTDENGNFSEVVNSEFVETSNYQVVFDADNRNFGSSSNVLIITSKKIATSITCSAPPTMSYGNVYYVQGTLKDEFNNTLPNKPILVTVKNQNETYTYQVNTNSSGRYYQLLSVPRPSQYPQTQITCKFYGSSTLSPSNNALTTVNNVKAQIECDSDITTRHYSSGDVIKFNIYNNHFIPLSDYYTPSNFMVSINDGEARSGTSIQCEELEDGYCYSYIIPSDIPLFTGEQVIKATSPSTDVFNGVNFSETIYIEGNVVLNLSFSNNRLILDYGVNKVIKVSGTRIYITVYAGGTTTPLTIDFGEETYTESNGKISLDASGLTQQNSWSAYFVFNNITSNTINING